MFDAIKDPKKLVAVLMSVTFLAPLAGCGEQTPKEKESWKKREAKIDAEYKAPSTLKSTCVNLTAGQVSYITERFSDESLVALTEVLALNPSVKCEKVAQVIKYLPRITDYLNESRYAADRSAIVHTAFAG
jgi:hypothetical protein